VAVAVALGVGAAGAAPIIVSTTQTEVTIGGLSCGTQYRVRVKVAGDSEVTTLNPVTKPCTTPQPPPPPPPPAGEVLYRKTGEGAAAVYGTGSLEEACYPNLPDIYGQTFCKWIKVTQYDPPQCGPVKDSAAPFAGANSIRYDVATGSANTRCEIHKARRYDAFTHDWYHVAFKLESDWGETSENGGVINQFNYAISAASLFLSADDATESAFLIVSAGDCNPVCTYYSGQPIGGGFAPRPAGMPGPLYVIPAGGLARNTWHEVLIHVYWSPLNDAELEAWYRPKGGTWVQRLDLGPVGSGHAMQFNFPTNQLGQSFAPQECSDPDDVLTAANINFDCHWPGGDKMGQYLAPGGYTSGDGTNTMWGEFCRASSHEAAETCLG
jgi:hypothetical protein